MKLICSIVLVVALATLVNTYSASWGFRVAKDKLLYKEDVYRKAQNNNYWSVNVDFPKVGKKNDKNITAIFVYDRFANNSGAAPSLRQGGPGFRFAAINLSSQYGRGMDSLVEIYGK